MGRSLAIVVLTVVAVPAQAINVVIDYTYAGSFFNPATTNGTLARASVDSVADYFSTIIDDNLDPITTPADFVSDAGGIASWSWNTSFPNPSGSGDIDLVDVPIAADEYRIYVGAEPIGGSTLGVGGFSTAGFSRSIGGNGFFASQAELDEIERITDEFEANLDQRGKPSGEWANWGGYLSLNSTETWHFDHTTPPTPGTNDLFSTVLHEVGHALGFGLVPEWDSQVSGDLFLGPNSFIANGNAFPVLEGPIDPGHWAQNTQSTVFGGTTPQEAAMDPNINVGTRKLWTTLDAAGLEDIGWNVVAPAAPDLPGDANGDGTVDLLDLDILGSEFGTTGGNSAADFNNDGIVDLLDLDILGSNFGQSAATTIPEPTALAILGIALLVGRTRR